MPHLQALEDAVYNNPMLLLDFKSVQVIYDTPHFMPLPAAMSPIATQIMTKAFPAEALQRAQIVQNQLGQLECDIAFAVPEAEMGFINRTFHNATIIHPLTPLASWMRARHPNQRRGKTLVNLRPHRLDLIILGDDAPLTINSYSITCAADALYYILAATPAARHRRDFHSRRTPAPLADQRPAEALCAFRDARDIPHFHVPGRKSRLRCPVRNHHSPDIAVRTALTCGRNHHYRRQMLKPYKTPHNRQCA